MIDLAVVPVAGHGTRLLPLTKSHPKEMLAVGRKPVVQYVVEELRMSGIRRVLFITGPGKSSIENHFDINAELITSLRVGGKEELLAELEFERQEVEYFYTRQRMQLGLGHAVLCARPLVMDQPFVVALGDSIIGVHAKSDIVSRMIDKFASSGAEAVLALEEVPNEEVMKYGIATPRQPDSEVFEIAELVEKPSRQEAKSNLAVAARYVFSPVIFDFLAQTSRGKGGEIQLTDAIQQLLRAGGKVIGMRMRGDEKRFDIGNFESYFRAFAEFALCDPAYGPELRSFLARLLETRDGGAPGAEES